MPYEYRGTHLDPERGGPPYAEVPLPIGVHDLNEEQIARVIEVEHALKDPLSFPMDFDQRVEFHEGISRLGWDKQQWRLPDLNTNVPVLQREALQPVPAAPLFDRYQLQALHGLKAGIDCTSDACDRSQNRC